MAPSMAAVSVRLSRPKYLLFGMAVSFRQNSTWHDECIWTDDQHERRLRQRRRDDTGSISECEGTEGHEDHNGTAGSCQLLFQGKDARPAMEYML